MSDRDIFAEIDLRWNGALMIDHMVAWTVGEFEEAHQKWPDRFTLEDGFASGIAALVMHITATFAIKCPPPYDDSTPFKETATALAQEIEDALWEVESGEVVDRVQFIGHVGIKRVFEGGMYGMLRGML